MSQESLKSYTSASSIPLKVIQDEGLVISMKSGFIPLRHLQLIPTNRCNLSCSFCSCSERDKSMELSLEELIPVLGQLPGLGCKAVTITGGGEPLLHAGINILIRCFKTLDINVGLVTNGTQFRRLKSHMDLTWCRISASDDRELDFDAISGAVQGGQSVDWAFSYVMTRNPNWENLCKIVSFANHHGFTHVRLVGDILDPEESGRLVVEAKSQFEHAEIDDRLVIYQPRADFTQGRRNCLISLLKPVIGADGYVYPCCGVQYAQDPPGKDMVESMRMGHMEDLAAMWMDRKYFDGTACTRCYYDNYNILLDIMSTRLSHKEFV